MLGDLIGCAFCEELAGLGEGPSATEKAGAILGPLFSAAGQITTSLTQKPGAAAGAGAGADAGKPAASSGGMLDQVKPYLVPVGLGLIALLVVRAILRRRKRSA